jgi:CRISPR-associated protein Csm2
LRPKLAYSAKRAKEKTPVADKLAAVLSSGIAEVVEGKDGDDKKQRFQRFADFFEAVLAYHKAHGGN